MLDTSRIEMVVDIPAHLIPYVHLIKDIEVTFSSFPDHKFKAAVKEIGEEASTTTRNFPVTLIMNQLKDAKIFAGMPGEAKFIGIIQEDSPRIALLVPASAVFSEVESGPSYVWIIDEKTKLVSKREVKIGELTSQGIRIIDGLQPGEWIAVAGVHFLREGQKVDILEPEKHLEG